MLEKKPPFELDWTVAREAFLEARRLPASASEPAVTENAMISATAVVRTRRMIHPLFIGHLVL